MFPDRSLLQPVGETVMSGPKRVIIANCSYSKNKILKLIGHIIVAVHFHTAVTAVHCRSNDKYFQFLRHPF